MGASLPLSINQPDRIVQRAAPEAGDTMRDNLGAIGNDHTVHNDRNDHNDYNDYNDHTIGAILIFSPQPVIRDTDSPPRHEGKRQVFKRRFDRNVTVRLRGVQPLPTFENRLALAANSPPNPTRLTRLPARRG
jgi:hypothetical protein